MMLELRADFLLKINPSLLEYIFFLTNSLLSEYLLKGNVFNCFPQDMTKY